MVLVENGQANGGESIYISNNPEVQAILGKENGIHYKDATPDFSPTRGEIITDSMTVDRENNFKIADELLAKEWNLSIKDMKKWRIQNKYTWHECNDTRTMQLIPRVINNKFGHLGGIAELKR